MDGWMMLSSLYHASAFHASFEHQSPQSQGCQIGITRKWMIQITGNARHISHVHYIQHHPQYIKWRWQVQTRSHTHTKVPKVYFLKKKKKIGVQSVSHTNSG